MVQRLLHQLEVTGLAQQLGAEVVPVVVEAEVIDPCLGAQPLPGCLGAGDGERVALAAHPAQPLVAVDRDIGEHVFRMLALQREEDSADGVSDREHHTPTTLPDPDDLARTEVHLRPLECDALFLTQAASPHELKERFIVCAHGLIKGGSLIVLQLAYPLDRLRQQ